MFTDLRLAVRQLAKTPVFTLLAVLSLGVGIGVNSTIFSALDAAFLRPLQIEKPDELVRFEWPSFSYSEYRELGADMHSLSDLVATMATGAILRTPEGTSTLGGSAVSPNYFTALGVRAAVGRLFSAADTTTRTGSVVVISHGLWLRQFGADPAIVGRAITLNERPFTVLGVAAPDFVGEHRIPATDLWLPAETYGDIARRTTRGFSLFGRLRPGATVAQVKAETEACIAHLGWNLPEDRNGKRLTVWTEAESTGDHGGRLTYLAIPLVGLVLLVACANVSGLLLARHEARQRELAVRAALGGSRWRLMRPLLVESLLLAVLGAAAGLLLTSWAIQLVPSLIPSILLSLVRELRIDSRVLGLSLGLSAFACLVFGVLPAWRASRPDLNALLKGSIGPSSPGRRRFSGRNLIVVAQLAVALVFLVAALLLVRGFRSGAAFDTGFREKNLLLVGVNPQMAGLGREPAFDYLARLQERLRALPGVRNTSLAGRAPLAISGGGASLPAAFPGDETAGAEGHPVKYNCIDSGYFATLGIPLLRGRDFNAGDHATAPRVAIVSESLARKHWPDRDPVGQAFRLGAKMEECTVVGVAHDIALSTLADASTPFVYLPARQQPRSEWTILIATKGTPAALTAAVRREMSQLDARVAPSGFETMSNLVRIALMPQWLGAWSGSVLGGLSVVLAMGGLFGSVAYSVTRRTREIGIRMALGAQRRETLWMILRQGLTLGLLGVAIGLPMAVGVGFVMQGLLFGISPVDPVALIGAVFLVLAVAVGAAVGPARRAMQVDPVEALRAE